MENYEEVLKRCPVCGRATRLTFFREFLEEPLTVDVVCDCNSPDPREDLKGIRRGEAFHNIVYDEKFKDSVFDNDDLRNARVTGLCKQYVIDFAKKFKKPKNGLMFIGGTGTGKSFYAGCIGNALIDAGYTVLVTTLPRLSADIGFNDLNERLSQLKQYQMLIIDDWGIERKTQIMDELLQTIIDERYRQRMPIIITSNRTQKQIVFPEDPTDHRIISRLAEMVDVLIVKGEDRRTEGNINFKGLTDG